MFLLLKQRHIVSSDPQFSTWNDIHMGLKVMIQNLTSSVNRQECQWCVLWKSDMEVVMPYHNPCHYVLHAMSASFHPTSVKLKKRSWRICLLSGHEGLGRLELSRRMHCKMSCTIIVVKYIVFLFKLERRVGMDNK